MEGQRDLGLGHTILAANLGSKGVQDFRLRITGFVVQCGCLLYILSAGYRVLLGPLYTFGQNT